MNTDPLCYRLPHEDGETICRDRNNDTDPSHCLVHQVDEPVDRGVYRICFECKHVYRTARSLWWANLRTDWRLARDSYHRPAVTLPDFLDDVKLPGRLRARLSWYWFMVRALVRRPSKIWMCAECSHDF